MTAARLTLAFGMLLLATSASASREVPFNVSIQAASAPVVGAEGTVTAKVEVEHDLPNLTIEIQPPADARITGNSTLVAGPVTPSKPVEFQTRVVFSTPGLKSVRAVAKSTIRPGVVLSDVAYVLLDIGTASSSLVKDPSQLRIAPRLVTKGDGLRQGRPVYKPETISSTTIPKVDLAGGPDGFVATVPSKVGDGQLVVTGRWSFTDRAGTVVGQRNAQVELRKPGVLIDTVLATTYTDWYGNFAFPAVTDPEDWVYVRCYTLSHNTGNLAAVRYNVASDWYSADTDMFRFLITGTHSVGEWCVDSSNPNYKAWWIVDDMTKAYNVPPDPTGGHVACWSPDSSGGAYFEEGGDIHLYGGDADDTPDTVLHEMGHSVMYNIYGDYIPDHPNCSPHTLLGDSSTGCAWTEGWAQTWHMWTTNDPVRTYPGGGAIDLEAATWGDGGDEGSDVEGRVAGALWDIADANNEGYDNFTDGWLNIWHIMYNHNCEKFSEFYSQWKSHGFGTHGAVACIYQNTIDWNTPPTFTGLPDITIAEDEFRANAISLDDYASDTESSDGQLKFTLVDVSDPNLQVGINSYHQVNMQGVTNWSGTAYVQVSCSDGIIALHDSFMVTVTPVNDAPVIKGIPDISVNEDSSSYHAVNLNVYTTDAETLPPNLTYSITGNTNTSCGATLVSGYYININPAADWSGTSDITVRATDPQGLWDEDTFRITVNPVNDPPVITGLPDRTLDEDTSLTNTIDLWAYATDKEIPASALSYFVQSSELPDGAVTIGSNRYVNITPPANYNGSGSVTIRVWDWEEGFGEDTFQVTVNPVSDPPAWDDIPDQVYETTKVSTYHDIDLYRLIEDPDGPDSELAFTVHRNTNSLFGASIYLGRYLRIAHGANTSGYTEITVLATDPTGLTCSDKLNVVVGRLCDPCSEAFGVTNGTYVIFKSKPVTWSHYYAFYIGDESRVSGIRVNYTDGPELNRYATLGGQMTTYEGERAVDCLSLSVGGTDTTPIQPVFMTHKSMGGVSPGSSTPAVPTGRLGGVYNVGTLVRTTGAVVSRNLNSFWIADGSGVQYSFSNKGLYVDCQPIVMRSPTRLSRVSVTGISGATTLLDGTVVNTLRLRNRDDLKGLGGRIAYIYDTSAPTAIAYANMLDEADWKTSTIHVSLVASTDLSAYDAIIIGTDTSDWTDTARVNHLVDSDKPIIAIGQGGARFLDQVPDLYIGWGNSGSFVLSQAYVADTGGDLFWWERIVPVPTDNLLSPLASDGYTLMVANPPSGVYGLLRHPTNASYWSVAYQGRYMQWGYATQPSTLSQAGKDLLVNAIYYMLAR